MENINCVVKTIEKLVLTSFWGDREVMIEELTKLHVHVRRVLGVLVVIISGNK